MTEVTEVKRKKKQLSKLCIEHKLLVSLICVLSAVGRILVLKRSTIGDVVSTSFVLDFRVCLSIGSTCPTLLADCVPILRNDCVRNDARNTSKYGLV